MKPATFAECLEHMHKCAELNASVRSLSAVGNADLDLPTNINEDLRQYAIASAAPSKNNAISVISDYLRKTFNAREFVPMVTSSKQANIAAVFYAGDGIVVKVTERRFLPTEHRPFQGGFTVMPDVLFPMHSVDIGDYKVEVFPWVDRKNITDDDVEIIKETMKKNNLEFSRGDGRPDNVGRLPNGRLVVLDGNAVQQIDYTIPIPTSSINRWTQEVFNSFSPLYTSAQVDGKEIPILIPESERSSDFFEEHFSSLIKPTSMKSRVEESGRSRNGGSWWSSRG